MKTVLKILAAPTMCLLALAVAICSFLLVVAGFICWFLTVAACIGGIILLLTHHVDGGIAFLILAFLVSPYGLPALFAFLVGKLNALRWSLKEFIVE